MARLLVVVDYQNDFVNGSLGFEGAELLDGPIAKKVREYTEAGDDVWYTLDTHDSAYMDTQEGKKLPYIHCVKGTEGHQLFGESGKLLADCNARAFEKDIFGSAEILEELKRKAAMGSVYDSIELVGLVSNICIIANAVLARAASPESRIIVDAACTDTYDKDLHLKTLDVLEGMQVEVTNR